MYDDRTCTQSDAGAEAHRRTGVHGTDAASMPGGMAPRGGGFSRRRFLSLTALTMASAAAGGAMTAVAAPRGGGGGGGGATTRNPLFVPPTITPTNASLTAATETVPFGTGKESRVWAFNGTVPGPTLTVDLSSGAAVEASIDFLNAMPHPSIVHWHGLEVDEPNDGGPHYAVNGGSSYSYRFPVDQRASLSWYHPHPHLHTAEQAYMGLYGAFVIRDAEELSKNLPSAGYELPLVVCDAILDSLGNLSYKPTSSGLQGKLPLVNGTLDPYLDVSPAVYRLRILNGANARVFRIALSAGSFTLIGNDGGLLPDVASGVSEIELAPAERVDVLIDLRARGGSSVLLQCRASGWTLLELRVANRTPVNNMPSLPQPSSTVPTWSSIPTLAAPAAVTRRFAFDGMSRINGQIYDMNRLDFEVPAGVVERWRFTTGGNAPHPVHIHGTHFQVLSRSGGRGRLLPWEAGWKDTVLLNNKETVDVAVRFDERFRGNRYLLHCHQLQHEDAGMMMNFKVV